MFQLLKDLRQHHHALLTLFQVNVKTTVASARLGWLWWFIDPLVMMAMSGLRHWTVREDAPMEVVPVDLVATSILIAAVTLLHGRAERAYQVSTADVTPICYGPLRRSLPEEYRRPLRHARPSLSSRATSLALSNVSVAVRPWAPNHGTSSEVAR